MKRILFSPLTIGLAVAAAVGVFVPQELTAQVPLTFNVNVTADTADANTGDGRCDSDGGVDGDQCSLRAAIQEANTLGGAFINLEDQTYTLTIAGIGENDAATGDLDVNVSGAPNEMMITGQGPDKTVVQACDDSGGPCVGIDRVFDIGPLFAGAIVTIRDLTIRNGQEPDFGGGGLFLNFIAVVPETAGGGLRTFGHAILENVVVTHNDGVGISSYDGSTLEIQDSVVSDNTDTGIKNRGDTVIEGTAIQGNKGRGIFNNFGTLRLTNSVISGNSGAEGAGFDNGDTADLINVVIIGNSCTGYGGGIAQTSNTVMNLRNVTITNNISDSDHSGNGDGGGISMSTGTVNFKNTIIAGNTDNNAATAPDCLVEGGTLVSGGYNLIGDDSGCVFTTGTGDQRGTSTTPVDAGLDPLTGIPLPGSPAIDRGNPASPGSGGEACEAEDARGVLRPEDGDSDGTATCDIGALEVGCGNGFIEPGEECDDGNRVDGDGCSGSCANEVAPACGDRILQAGETCDDGNTTNGDGCDSNCRNETGTGTGGTTGGAATGGSSGGTVEPLSGGCGLIPE